MILFVFAIQLFILLSSDFGGADIVDTYRSLNKKETKRISVVNAPTAITKTNTDSNIAAKELVIDKMPKIELHAHLHGSIRRSTLESLAREKNISLDCDYRLDLDQCFGLFKVVHQVISSQEILRRVVSEILEDFMADNVIYLELRSTPRSLADGTTDRQYIYLLKSLISNHNAAYASKMLVKLIVSVDRSKSVNFAMETLQIIDSVGIHHVAKNSNSPPQKVIVGLDFSGNPLGGRFEDFASVFTRGREMGLNITVHCAEIKQLSYGAFSKGQKTQNFDTDETTFILSFKYDIVVVL